MDRNRSIIGPPDHCRSENSAVSITHALRDWLARIPAISTTGDLTMPIGLPYSPPSAPC